MGVDFLFQHAEVVPNHDDFVEEHFQGDFLGLQRGVAGVQDEFAAVPAEAELFHDGVRLLQAKFGDGDVQGLADELGERHVEAANGHGRVEGFQTARLGGDGAFGAVVELDFGDHFGNGFDGAGAVLRMAHAHADADGFNCHGGILTAVGRRWNTDFKQKKFNRRERIEHIEDARQKGLDEIQRGQNEV